jgi:hypothetical protein
VLRGSQVAPGVLDRELLLDAVDVAPLLRLVERRLAVPDAALGSLDVGAILVAPG